MGILNRTPDSFSDGGQFLDDGAALSQLDAIKAEGADLIDVGAESTRPGSRAIPAREQIARLGTIVRAAAERFAVVSVDTTSPEVAAWGLDEGASAVNSVSLEAARELGALCARRQASLLLMHSRGSMSDMRGFSVYDDRAYGDVVEDVRREWLAAAQQALDAGLPKDALIFDPGLGFAKNARHSLELCARLHAFMDLGVDMLVGPSNKSFLVSPAAAEGWPTPAPAERLPETLAAAVACVQRGARIVRVHDVGPVRRALMVFEAMARMERFEGRPAPGAENTKPAAPAVKEAIHA